MPFAQPAGRAVRSDFQALRQPVHGWPTVVAQHDDLAVNDDLCHTERLAQRPHLPKATTELDRVGAALFPAPHGMQLDPAAGHEGEDPLAAPGELDAVVGERHG